MLNRIKILGRETGARPWRRWFPDISSQCEELACRADAVLRSSSRLATSLLNLEAEIRTNMRDGQKVDDVLDIVLGNRECERGFPTHVRMADELNADEFMGIIRSGTPFRDVGVSILHGSQTHRIQFRILADHMGSADTRELLKQIATPVSTCDTMPRRPDPTGPAASDQFHFEISENQPQKHLTMYDDLFDVQSPIFYPNEEKASMGDIFSGVAQHEKVVINKHYFPVLDARSPEWLQHLLISSSDLVPLLSKATGTDVHNRLGEVHKGVFATGFETCDGGLLSDPYKALGFSCGSSGGTQSGVWNRSRNNRNQMKSTRGFHSSTAYHMPDAAIAQLKGAYGSSDIDSSNKEQVSSQNKQIPMVVGASFPRTGTNSLKLALERLGFGPAYHIQEMCVRNHLPLWDVPNAVYTRKPGEPYSYGHFPTLPDFDKILREPGFRSGVDVPFCLFWKDIYKHFDGAKVVLSLRDPESWYKSCFDTIYKTNLDKSHDDDGHPDSVPLERRMAYKAIPELKRLWEWETKTHWDPWLFHSKTEAIDSYLAYQDHVRASVPAEDLLEFRVQDGWDPLCEFLGVDKALVDGEDFPRVNDTRSQLLEAEKVDAIGRAIGVAAGRA